MVYSQVILCYYQVPTQISCFEDIVCENFTTRNTLETLFSVYELISKTECQEVRLIFFTLIFFPAGEPCAVELIAPNM
jgi:hypothetical protein